MTEAALAQIEALDPASPCAQDLSKIPDVGKVITEEIDKIYNAATLAEITKILFLVLRLKKAPGQEGQAVKSKLKKITEELVTRVEAESGPLRLPETCQHLLLKP